MRFLLICVVMLFHVNNQAFAAKIAAIVNNESITLSEVEQRKKMIILFSNPDSNIASRDQELTKVALNSLINDYVLLQHANKINFKVSEQEIMNFIRNLETANKLSNGQLEEMARHNNITRGAFMSKMRIEVLISKMVHELFSDTIDIKASDVDDLILNTRSKDAELQLKVFTAKNKNAYKNMQNLSKKNIHCNDLSKVKYSSFATLEDLKIELSKLPANVRGIVQDLYIGKVSSIIVESDGTLKVYVLCAKSIKDLSNDELHNVSQILLHQKLNSKFKKFMQDLRKKSYVKTMI